jgi:hypothetical protein
MPNKFVRARWQRAGRRKAIRLIVVHCTVSPEMGTGAEAVARYFSTTDRKGSAHKVGDSNSVVDCVRDGDTAYGAAGANDDGLHFELVGMPDQSLAQWLDPFSQSMFETVGPDIREWMQRYGIPGRWLTAGQIRDGRTSGFCTHADVQAVFPSTGHWDPGPNFPHSHFLHVVTAGSAQQPVMPDEEADVVAEVYAMYRLYLRMAPEAVDASEQFRKDVSFHAWEISSGRVTLEKKRADIEAWATAAGLYPQVA